MSDKMGMFIVKTGDSSKPGSRLLKMVDLSVALVRRGDEVLTCYNDKWGAFALPMSKRREIKDPNARDDAGRLEDGTDAAFRAAAEWMGQTLVDTPPMIMDMAEFQQSDRDSVWKRYHLQVFEFRVEDDYETHPARVVEWLTPDEILDEGRRPISHTTRHVINELRSKSLL
ncbi:MAG: hypothetical protein FJ224_05085 [Lentisphaerae bacterium]|nr:hypothetical protein [Lentisphaerota bacterium]